MQHLHQVLPRVEGSLSLDIFTKEGKLNRIALENRQEKRGIAENLVGRKIWQVPHISGRICGSCSVAHHFASLAAIEASLGIQPTEDTITLRKLANMGNMIANHAFHLTWLVMPDHRPNQNVAHLIGKGKKDLEIGSSLYLLGNRIKRAVIGRELHPLGTAIGGWASAPDGKLMAGLKEEINQSLDKAQKLTEVVASLDTEFFARKSDYACVSDGEYPSLSGKLKNQAGMELPFDRNHRFVTGALARMNCTSGKLTNQARRAVKSSRVIFPNYNPFMNNFCQAVETVHYLGKCVELLDHGITDTKPLKGLSTGEGFAAVESPKGIVMHEYRIGDGRILEASIITSADFNHKNMEEDLSKLLPRFMKLTKDDLFLEAGKLVRAYDPCIGCAVR